MPDLLNIVPSSVELKGGDSQAFEARDATGNPVAGVTWSMQDRNAGSIGADDGVYAAAARVYKTRRLAVLARQLQKGADGKETVTAQGSAEIGRTEWTEIHGFRQPHWPQLDPLSGRQKLAYGIRRHVAGQRRDRGGHHGEHRKLETAHDRA